MSKKIKYILLLHLVLSLTARAQLPPSLPEYELVYYDEFDTLYPTTIINDSLWDRTPEWNQGTNVTGSMSWCVSGADTLWDKAYMIRDKTDSSTIKVSNGTCKLLTDSTDYMGEVWSWPNGVFTIDTIPFKYRTGTLYSRKTFRYGYYEIKFKLPPAPATPFSHQGFGPNFWLFAADTTQNNWWSEIDFFEIDAKHQTLGENLYTCNVHYSDKDSSWHPTQGVLLGNITSNVWHKASGWWTPEFIKIYYDDSLINTIQNNPLIPVDSLVEMRMIIDINSPAANFCTNFDTSFTQFPYTYEIDYVRVYQIKQECDTDKVYCNVSAGTFESGLYKSLTIGGTGCNASFSSSANITGLGNDFVLLDEGFSFDNSSQGYFDVLRCDPKQHLGLRINQNPPEPPPSSWLRKFRMK